MCYETRFEIPPVSSLTDNKIDKNKNKWYSLNEVEQDAQENNTISSQDVSKNIYSRGKLGRNIRGQELDNGSFSLNKNQIMEIYRSIKMLFINNWKNLQINK